MNSKMNFCRMLLSPDADPFRNDQSQVTPWAGGNWRARWINHPAQGPGVDGVAFFQRRFQWPGGELRLHVSADQRFRLFLDGTDLGGGPERGDKAHWRYHSWAGELPAGEHLLWARVWWLKQPPTAQCSIRPAFLCAGEGGIGADLLDTGHASWQVRLERNWENLRARMCWGTGTRVRVHLDASSSTPADDDLDWENPVVQGPAFHRGGGASDRGGRLRLVPAQLPAQREQRGAGGRVLLVTDAPDTTPEALGKRMLDVSEHRREEAEAWQALLDMRGTVHLPTGTRRRVLIDLGDYRCAYPEVTLSGHGVLRISWAEACFIDAAGKRKGQRDEWQTHFFQGVADEFVVADDRDRRGATLWWESGRFVELVAEATTSGFTVRDLGWRETGYPLAEEGMFSCDDEALQASFAVMQRTLRRCAHETFMDCPYYEQLQYAGDTRLQCQVVRALGRDHRLCDQAIDAFAHSMRDEGRLSSRWPTREWQDIPTFSLVWVGMLHDALMWGGDVSVVRRHLVTMRTIMEHFRSRLRPDGLLGWVEGWNFVDWVPGWPAGEIPGERMVGGAAVNSFLLAYAARMSAEIEDWAGEPVLAERNRDLAVRVIDACSRVLWDEAAGCFADTAERRNWSEHAQILALLAGVDSQRQERLLHALSLSKGAQANGTGYDFSPAALVAAGFDYSHPTRMAQPTVYFSHYRFEVAACFRRPGLLFDRLDYWRDLLARGFSTVPEMPEPSRSDCHAWGAHPRFHAVASILGIRPAAPEFSAVRIVPMLGALGAAEGTWPHPLGDIRVRLHRRDGQVHGRIDLPTGLPGVWVRDDGQEEEIDGSLAW